MRVTFLFRGRYPGQWATGRQVYTGSWSPYIVFTMCAHLCIVVVRTKEQWQCRPKVAKTRNNRDENINLRASQSQKGTDHRAADALARN